MTSEHNLSYLQRKEGNVSLNVVRKVRVGMSVLAFNEFDAIVFLNSLCHAGSIICCWRNCFISFTVLRLM